MTDEEKIDLAMVNITILSVAPAVAGALMVEDSIGTKEGFIKVMEALCLQ